MEVVLNDVGITSNLLTNGCTLIYFLSTENVTYKTEYFFRMSRKLTSTGTPKSLWVQGFDDRRRE